MARAVQGSRDQPAPGFGSPLCGLLALLQDSISPAMRGKENTSQGR